MVLSGTNGSVGWSDLVASAAHWEAASAVSLPLSRTAERVPGVLRVSLNAAGKGLGYTDPPAVTFSAPDGGGRGAAGAAVLGQRRIVGQEDIEIQLGTVSRVDVSDSGDYGLLDTPRVTFSAPVDKGSLSRLKWSRGSGYVEAPAVTVSDAPAGGTTARLEALILDGEVVGFWPPDRGAGYTSRSHGLDRGAAGGWNAGGNRGGNGPSHRCRPGRRGTRFRSTADSDAHQRYGDRHHPSRDQPRLGLDVLRHFL